MSRSSYIICSSPINHFLIFRPNFLKPILCALSSFLTFSPFFLALLYYLCLSPFFAPLRPLLVSCPHFLSPLLVHYPYFVVLSSSPFLVSLSPILALSCPVLVSFASVDLLLCWFYLFLVCLLVGLFSFCLVYPLVGLSLVHLFTFVCVFVYLRCIQLQFGGEESQNEAWSWLAANQLAVINTKESRCDGFVNNHVD